MPRTGEPRIVVRLSEADLAVIEAAAGSVGVATGALVRECAVRFAAQVARDVSAGRVKLRRRSASSLSAPAASSSAVEEGQRPVLAPRVPGKRSADEERPGPSRGPSDADAASLRPSGEDLPPGVQRAIAFRAALLR